MGTDSVWGLCYPQRTPQGSHVTGTLQTKDGRVSTRVRGNFKTPIDFHQFRKKHHQIVLKVVLYEFHQSQLKVLFLNFISIYLSQKFISLETKIFLFSTLFVTLTGHMH